MYVYVYIFKTCLVFLLFPFCSSFEKKKKPSFLFSQGPGVSSPLEKITKLLVW